MSLNNHFPVSEFHH